MLLPGEYYRAKVINVLLPENVKSGNKENAATKTKVIKKYYYRGNVIKRKL